MSGAVAGRESCGFLAARVASSSVSTIVRPTVISTKLREPRIIRRKTSAPCWINYTTVMEVPPPVFERS
ncbi:hypothetical protein ATANTOWER_002626 [Ataeniobius toweri]|uniref:Uncharacterized protein n=1 Tax=Ataeniobius toweri TaxID=208326 RepID=A0ABU7C2I3_9TELE|nr:hypothetical protein [Ataeniobius toweri]